jgi:hypothetical protein
METQNINLIYIVGAGRSGSTILDRTLGHHSKMLSLGELINLRQEYENNALCGCGTPIRDCPHWSDIFKQMKTNNTRPALEEFIDLKYVFEGSKPYKAIRRLGISAQLLLGKVPADPGLKRAIANTRTAYQLIFDKSGAQILVDSSKSLNRALYLSTAIPGINPIFLHLVRDGRAVLHSTQKDTYSVRHKDASGAVKVAHHSVSPKKLNKAIEDWSKDNRQILQLKRLFRLQNYYFIRYEEFTSNPQKALLPFMKMIQLSWESAMLNFEFGDNHMVCGNSSRLNAFQLEKKAEKWPTELTPETLAIFNKKAGHLNRKLGYS